MTPNFFLLGAPKCGTTALAAYLKEHPAIFFCSPKEPDYWPGDMLRPERATPLDSLEDYLSLFAAAGPKHQVAGEGSTSYCYSNTAVPRILEFCPAAKLIMFVRNPVDLAASFHRQMVWSFWDPEPDFERAWRSQTAEQSQQLARRSLEQPVSHSLWRRNYRFVGSIGTRLREIRQQAPPEQLLVLLYEDFLADPRAVYLQVLEHLGVPDDGRQAFPKVNVSKDHKYQWLAQYLIDPPRWLVRVRNIACGTRWWGAMHALRDTMLERFSVPMRTTAMRPEFKAELVAEFADEISLIEDLMGRDLSHWRRLEAPRRQAANASTAAMPAVEAPLGGHPAV